MKMKKAVWAAAVIAAACTARSEYLIDDEIERVVIGSLDFGTNAIVMGNLTSGNGLTIRNGGSVTAAEAYFGYSSGSTGNFVNISEASALALRNTLVLGYASSGNTMDIAGGGLAYSVGNGVVGYLPSATDNSVLVSGEDSVWATEENIYIGYLGSANRMRILNGGTVLSDNGIVGVGGTASNNTVLVSGSGSAWTNFGGLFIGNTNSIGNAVTVTNGGSVTAHERLEIFGVGNEFNLERDGTLRVLGHFDASMAGFNFNEGGALYVGGVLSNAAASVEGERTLGLIGTTAWWNRSGSNVVVGASSSGNTLLVEEGGRVDADDVLVGTGNSAAGNRIAVTGEGSLLNIADTLSIGTASNANNLVEVSAGGMIRLGGALLPEGSGSTFNLDDGGWLVVSNGLDASIPGFNFLAGGTLESMGALSGMDPLLEDRRSILLTGSNAVWNLGANMLHVGSASSSNTLQVLDGAYLAGAGAMIGTTGSVGNLVRVSGSGSVWANAGDLALAGDDNALDIADEGRVTVGGSLRVMNGSAVSFASGGHAAASGYYQDGTSTFSFDNVTNTPANPVLLKVDGTAVFEAGATMEFTGSISGLERGIVFTNQLVSAGSLVVDGVTNAVDEDLDALNVAGPGSLLHINLVSEGDDLMALISRMRLADSAGFEPGSDMEGVSEEIDQMADAGDPLAENMLNTLSLLDSSAQNRQLSQLYDRHAPSYAHSKGMLDGFRETRKRGVVPNLMLPRGAFGPHFYNAPAQGWVRGYGSRGQRDGSQTYSDYDQSVYGVLVGVDKSFGEIQAGVAGGMAISDISQDDGDRSEAQTGYGLLYASWGTISWFGDLNLGYGRSSIEDRSGTLFNTRAEYDADQLGFYLGGGRELVFRDERLFVTPSAALSGSYYLQESYTENSTAAVPRRIDEFDYFSMQSELGLKLSYTHDLKRSVLVPEMHAAWRHEFNADEERIDYSLAGGTGRYRFGMEATVEELYEIGTGISWWMFNRQRKVYEWYGGFDGRFGDGYTEFMISLRLLSRF